MDVYLWFIKYAPVARAAFRGLRTLRQRRSGHENKTDRKNGKVPTDASKFGYFLNTLLNPLSPDCRPKWPLIPALVVTDTVVWLTIQSSEWDDWLLTAIFDFRTYPVLHRKCKIQSYDSTSTLCIDFVCHCVSSIHWAGKGLDIKCFYLFYFIRTSILDI